MITPNQFSKAKSSALRRKTLAPTGKIRQRGGPLWWLCAESPLRPELGRRVPSNTTVVSSTAKSLPTACWEWDKGGPRHLIRIGDRLDEAFYPETSSTDAKNIELVKSVIAHEVCHAAYTSLDRADINRRLADYKLKFRFHNLAEDCRIEWKYLKERGKDHRFGWLKHNELPGMTAPTNNPSTYLWQLKSREPALFKTIASAAAPLKWTGLATFVTGVLAGHRVDKVIQKFYQRFVEAPDEHALIPIEKEWVDLFGHEVESVTGVSDFDESGGLAAAAAAAASGGGAEGASAPVSSGIGSAAAMAETGPKTQEDFLYPGDVPLDIHARIAGLSPLSAFMH
jgi:hypothetical protein